MLAILALAFAPALAPAQPICAPGAAYYAFPLVTTKNVTGTGLAVGTAHVSFSAASPFIVTVAGDGSYRYEIDLALDRMRQPRAGTLVAWAATPELDEVARLGVLDGELHASGSVEWNKFLVIVTLETDDDPAQARWAGPVAFRGMSRSGAMHTMVGHGALQQENCAAWGYGN